MNYGLLALVAIGCAAMAALVWFGWLPAEVRRILKRKPPETWPQRNEGGGYHQRDGSITRDPEGREPIGRR